MKVFIKVPDCEAPLRVFRKYFWLPRLLKDRYLPPSIKLIQCPSDSEDLGVGVKQTNKEIELEAKEDAEEGEELSDTPYDEEGEVSQDAEDAASSAEDTKRNQKEEEVVKVKKPNGMTTQGRKKKSKSYQGEKSKKSKKKPAKHALSEHEIPELARKVEDRSVAELNKADSACIREVPKLSVLYVPEGTERDDFISEISHAVAQGVDIK